VFVSIRGRRLTQQTIGAIVNRCAARARLPTTRISPVGSNNSAELQVPTDVRLTEALGSRSQPVGRPNLRSTAVRVHGRVVAHELHPTPVATLFPDPVGLGQPPAAEDH
jgi:hypothetical protein